MPNAFFEGSVHFPFSSMRCFFIFRYVLVSSSQYHVDHRKFVPVSRSRTLRSGNGVAKLILQLFFQLLSPILGWKMNVVISVYVIITLSR